MENRRRYYYSNNYKSPEENSSFDLEQIPLPVEINERGTHCGIPNIKHGGIFEPINKLFSALAIDDIIIIGLLVLLASEENMDITLVLVLAFIFIIELPLFAHHRDKLAPA